MNILTNYYGDVQIRFLWFLITLDSGSTSAWRNLTIHVGNTCLLWTQLSFWSEPSPVLRQKLAGIRWFVTINGREWWNFTVLPLVPFLSYYKKPWNRPAGLYNKLVWWIAKRYVDRRYAKHWEAFRKADANRWAGVTGNALLEFKPRAIPSISIPQGLTAKLVGKAPNNKGFIDFQLVGLPIAQDWHASWVKNGSSYPFCDISLYIDSLSDIKEGAYLSSFGGCLWPAAWPEYFRFIQGTAHYGSQTLLSKKGAELLKAALN